VGEGPPEVVAEGPAPSMWDSSAGDDGGEGPGSVDPSADPSVASESSTSSPDGAGTDAADPLTAQDGDHREPVTADLSGGSLTVLPDEGFLADPATTYPVVVDPTVGLVRARWAQVDGWSGRTGMANHQWTGDEGVGYVNDSSGVARKRLFWQFDSQGKLNGKQVLNGTLRLVQTHQYNCDTRATTQVWGVSPLPGTVTWNSQPGWRAHRHTLTGAWARSGCPPDPKGWELNGKPFADDMLSRGESVIAVGLKASDEGTANLHWRRFSPDASLSITVNTSPNVPSSLDLVGAGGCAPDPQRQWLNVPSLTASFVTSDRDNPPDNVLGQVEVRARPDRSVAVKTVATALRGSPHLHSIQIINNTSEDHYWWRVRAQDAHGAWSAWTGWCNVIIDKTAPNAVTVSSSAFTPDGGIRVGQSGTVTLARAAVDADVVGYRWGTCPVTSLECGVEYATTAVTTTTTASSAGITFTPTRAGPHRIVARAVDRAGNLGPPGHLDFYVDFADPAGVWGFNENAGRWAFSHTDGTQVGARMNGGAATSWVAGAGTGTEVGDHAVAFDGSGGSATMPTPYVVDTGRSHALGLHVTPPAAGRSREALVSVNGTASSGLWFGWDENQRLEYRLALAPDAPRSDWNDPRWFAVRADIPAHLRQQDWVHVAVGYDDTARRATLYVDGTAVGSGVVPQGQAPVSAPGDLLLGSSCQLSGTTCTYHDRFQGSVDNLRVYPFPVSELQVRTWTSVAVEDPAFMRPGETLREGGERFSTNGSGWLRFTGGSLLRTYTITMTINSHTSGTPLPDRVVMQSDGNLVAYAGSTATWHTNTAGNPGAFLRIGNDGKLRIVTPDNVVLWEK